MCICQCIYIYDICKCAYICVYMAKNTVIKKREKQASVKLPASKFDPVQHYASRIMPETIHHWPKHAPFQVVG